MSGPRIPFLRPCMPGPEEWLPFLRDSYATKRFSNFGPANQRLEHQLTSQFGFSGRTFLLTSSATSGLAAMLLALGVHGRVALPAFTFPATMQAIQMAGCEPVLCDVDPDTWEMSAATLEPVLAQGRIDAVLPVRAFGFCRDFRPLLQLCADAGMPVIFDSAAGFGGELDTGGFVGSHGIAEVFSFHATKVFGIGEGGGICVDEAIAEDVRSALNFGIAPRSTGRGLNGKLSEFAAAVGLAVLEHLHDFAIHRRRLVTWYLDALSHYPSLTLPAGVGNPVWQCVPVLLGEDIETAEFIKRSLQMGVEIRRYYHPALSLCEDISFVAPVSLQISKQLAERMVCLPLYSDMSTEEQDDVLRAVEDMLA